MDRMHLKHSIEVAHLAGLLAGEIGVDVRTAKTCRFIA